MKYFITFTFILLLAACSPSVKSVEGTYIFEKASGKDDTYIILSSGGHGRTNAMTPGYERELQYEVDGNRVHISFKGGGNSTWILENGVLGSPSMGNWKKK